MINTYTRRALHVITIAYNVYYSHSKLLPIILHARAKDKTYIRPYMVYIYMYTYTLYPLYTL